MEWVVVVITTCGTPNSNSVAVHQSGAINQAQCQRVITETKFPPDDRCRAIIYCTKAAVLGEVRNVAKQP